MIFTTLILATTAFAQTITAPLSNGDNNVIIYDSRLATRAKYFNIHTESGVISISLEDGAVTVPDTMKSPGVEFWKAVRRAYPLPPTTSKIAYIDGKKRSFVKTCDGKYVRVITAEDAVVAFGKLYNCGGN